MAQDKQDKRGSVGLYGGIENSLAQAAVRDWLRDQTQPLPEKYRFGSSGLLLKLGRLIVAGQMAGAGDERGTNGHIKTFGGGHGSLDAGLILFQTRHWRVYPLIGVGGLGGTVVHTPRGDSAAEPTRDSWGGGYFARGFGIDFMFKLWRLPVFIGARFGYRAALGSIQIGDGPDTDANCGPFFCLVWGVGG